MADFGSDVSVFPDLDAAFAPMTGGRVVLEAVAKRLCTPRGGLLYSPDYGWDLRDYLNDAITSAKLSQWQREIERECEADERVDSASASIVYDDQAQSLRITIGLVTAEGPFTLVLGVSKLTLTILDTR
jgi:hypothetical protein